MDWTDPNLIRFFVPTRGRLHRPSTTLDQLQAAGLDGETVIVCPYQEANEWQQRFPLMNVLSEPAKNENIGQCRAFILETAATHGFRYAFMIDDDIKFSFHPDEGGGPAINNIDRFRYLLRDYTLALFQIYPVVGIGSRLWSQDRPLLWENRQTGWAWGYDVPAVIDVLRPVFGRLVVHEDTDWCLTLLEQGYKNVIQSYLLLQGRSVADTPEEGGCGLYRNVDLVLRETEKFIAFHPHCVTPREPRPGLSAQTQYRHTVHWSRAYRPKGA